MKNGPFHNWVLWYLFSNTPIAYCEIPLYKANLNGGNINNLVKVEPAPKSDRCLVSENKGSEDVYDALWSHSLPSKFVTVAQFPVRQ